MSYYYTEEKMHMSFTEMKRSVNRLNTQLKVLGALAEPKHLYIDWSSVADGSTWELVELIYGAEQYIVELSQKFYDIAERYSTLVSSFPEQLSYRRALYDGPAIRDSGPVVPRLPNEIAIEIFKCLVEDGSHHLKPLLFVNKWSHALVTSTPSLWCNITIGFDSNFQELNGLTAQFIQSCLEYSRTSSLNITLDMSGIPFPNEYISSLISRLGEVVPYPRLISGDFHVDAGDEDSHFYVVQQRQVEEVVKKVIGTAGCYMWRWRSFKFRPSNPDLRGTETIWEFFNYPTPNLETFELNSHTSMENIDFNIAFPNLGAVRYLTLPSDGLLNQASLSYHLLKTLEVRCDDIGTLMDTLEGCRGLQELAIDRISGSSPSMQHIRFPLLKKLRLSGEVDTLRNFSFETPLLENLILHSSDLLGCPTVQARSVLWIACYVFLMEPESDVNHSVADFLRLLLVQIKGIEELSVDCGTRKELVSVVQEVISQGDSSTTPSLRIIHFDVDDW